ncbi:ribosome-associated translation inhibitor RaiA [Neptuniibacter sp. CAU 1671]|uniref:ribosome hibernation-promoting factor, HPF/YfiA family n=1 Tax=Neptuniibacter sp. CAU 1671 TaxID=3032593 RepID=UPI0023DAA5E6|nr:ribosome-associated translation inhibitor RaiA [Neptuniibacter sp. CAU 1671]MDF2180676.1 ribosome-associated translation inhibitor RaiA [Neptuniibacter sp. CAU 1671]
MNINITHRNDKVSPSVRERIEGWLETCQQRYDDISSAQVILDKSDRENLAEARVHIAGKDLFAKAAADNLYSALDALEDKINKQLDKEHQKHISKKGLQKPAVENTDDLEDSLEPA